MKKKAIEDIMKNLEESSGLTRFFINLALKSANNPNAIPSLQDAPRLNTDYKKISFEGIKCSGKDYHISMLLKEKPDLVIKPKFKSIFPFKYLDDLRKGGIFGGIPDTLLLASAYAYDEEFYKEKSIKWYVQNRGIYTYATMEILRLEKETNLPNDKIRNFVYEIISTIGLPEICIYLDVDISTAIERSEKRNKNKPSKEVLKGEFLEEQLKLQREYDLLITKYPISIYKITSSNAHNNISTIIGYISEK